ncbi:hypothetical protein CYY_003679 [Polysphondylium violaceum]|uniref:Vacuolar protein sorting-associated protein 54 C-terminal domain-containing protein n=1 Tax=Polysphondylium violaceum TaxID=133409 RepID=A0A8J4PYR6_9MYCE|nr:hypothetical protein CYY_003679 [Polysphondylium violaceum]
MSLPIQKSGTGTSLDTTTTTTNSTPTTSSNNSSPSSLTRSSSQLLFEKNNYEPFIFAQSLTSVCLDPMTPIPNEWEPADLQVPPLPNSSSLGSINLNSFQNYLNKISPVYKIYNSNKNRELIPTNKKTQEEIISLDNVPEFFFKKNLTKSEILNYANSDPSPILFQKLEHYSTIIEENIVGHVRDKSLAFFSAMSELKQFRQELILLSKHVKNSDHLLDVIDDTVINSLKITQLHLQKNRIQETIDRLQLISDVKQTQPTLQLLLSKGDYMGALDLIYSTKYALEFDLCQTSCLKNLSPQLIEMISLIEKMSIADFIKIALNDDLLLQNDNPDNNDNSNDSNNTDNNNNNSLEQNIEDMLIPLIRVILRIGKIEITLEQFRDSCIQSIKQLFKTVVSNVIYDIDQGKIPSFSSSVYRNSINNNNRNNNNNTSSGYSWVECKSKLIKLSPTDSLPLFKAIDMAFRSKFKILSKIMNLIINEISTDSNSSNNSNNNNNNNNIFIQHTLDSTQVQVLQHSCNSLLYSINETMQERISSLIKARAEINSKMALTDFVCFYNQIKSFLDFSESSTPGVKRKSIILRSTFLSQAKLFLDILHKNRLSSLSLLLENEDWIQVQVVSEFQNIVNHLVNLSLDHEENESNNSNNEEQQQQQDNNILEEICISGEPFKVVNTGLMLIKFINDYTTCIEQLPSLTIDSIPKLIELLHTFNQMTYQLVLGAGARQTMKLKTITSKHLGLASQCLSLVIKFIPYLKTFLTKRLESKQYPLLNGLDKLLQDYTSHRQEIFTKFVVIIKERCTHQLKLMVVTDLKNDSLPIPTPPIAALVKDLSTLHKLLAGILSSEQVFKVFTNVYFMFNGLFLEYVDRFDLSSKSAKRRIHNDIAHMLANLRKLPNCGEPGNQIEEYINQHYPI